MRGNVGIQRGGIEISGIETRQICLSVTLSRAYKWNSEDAGHATADLNGPSPKIFSRQKMSGRLKKYRHQRQIASRWSPCWSLTAAAYTIGKSIVLCFFSYPGFVYTTGVSEVASILPLLPSSRWFIAVMPKNNNTPKTNNKRGTYRRFDGPIKLMRRSEIRGYAIRYLDNVAENNGKCKHGFMAGLVREASSENNALQINSRDIETEVARIVAEQRKVSPELSGTTKASTTINEPVTKNGRHILNY